MGSAGPKVARSCATESRVGLEERARFQSVETRTATTRRTPSGAEATDERDHETSADADRSRDGFGASTVPVLRRGFTGIRVRQSLARGLSNMPG